MRVPYLLVVVIVLVGLLPTRTMAEEYMSRDAFLKEAFQEQPHDALRHWLTKPQKSDIARILGHGYAGLRVPYWKAGSRTAWVLEEVGKEQPITIGVVVNGGIVERVRVLAFRESRGWEVRHAFFTDQFAGAGLRPSLDLDRPIDGITGATLSVRAVTKVSRVALYLHRQLDASVTHGSPQ